MQTFFSARLMSLHQVLALVAFFAGAVSAPTMVHANPYSEVTALAGVSANIGDEGTPTNPSKNDAEVSDGVISTSFIQAGKAIANLGQVMSCPSQPAAITISGFANPYTGANGIYVASAVFNVTWRWTKGPFSIFWTGTKWEINLTNTAGSFTLSENSGGSIFNIPCGGWSTTSFGNPGTLSGGCGAIPVPDVIVPSVSISASPAGPVLENVPVTYSATPTDGGSAPQYQWYINGQVLNGADEQSLTIAFDEGDQISVRMTSNAPCAFPAEVFSNVITVEYLASIPQQYCAEVECESAGGNTWNLGAYSVGRPVYLINIITLIKIEYVFDGPNGHGWYTILYDGAVPYYLYYNSSDAVLPPLTGWVSVSSICTSDFTLSDNMCAPLPSTPSVCADVACFSGGTQSGNFPLLYNNRPIYFGSTGGITIYGLEGLPFPNAPTTFPSTGWFHIFDANFVNYYTNTSTENTFPETGWSFIGTPPNGCTPAITVGSVTPLVSITADPSTTICPGASVTFTATPTYGGTAATYQWQKGGVNISGETNPTFTSATLADGEVITCVMTSNAACASTPTATSNELTIIEKALPVINDTIVIQPSCTSFFGSIEILAAGQGALEYTLTPGVSTSWQTSPLFENLTPRLYRPAVRLASDPTCAVFTPTNPISIWNVTALNATVSSTPAKCFGTPTGRGLVTATGGVRPYTYLWSNGATIRNPADLPPGTNTVTVTDALGCTAEQSVMVGQATQILFTVTRTGTGPFTTTVAASGGSGPYQYAVDGVTAYQSSNEIVIPTTGRYIFSVKDSKGCVQSRRMLISATSPMLLDETELGDAIVERDEITSAPAIALYPNPSTGRVLLELLGTNSAENNILVVTNALGQTVLQQKLYTYAGEATELDLSGLTSGIYNVSVILPSGEKMTERLVIAR